MSERPFTGQKSLAAKHRSRDSFSRNAAPFACCDPARFIIIKPAHLTQDSQYARLARGASLRHSMSCTLARHSSLPYEQATAHSELPGCSVQLPTAQNIYHGEWGCNPRPAREAY
jgi:hypothetical protein